jgi:hypothetical protein
MHDRQTFDFKVPLEELFTPIYPHVIYQQVESAPIAYEPTLFTLLPSPFHMRMYHTLSIVSSFFVALFVHKHRSSFP